MNRRWLPRRGRGASADIFFVFAGKACYNRGNFRSWRGPCGICLRWFRRVGGVVDKIHTVRPRRKALGSTVQSTYYEGPEPGTVTCFFKDDVLLPNPDCPVTLPVPGKGALNNRISSYILEGLTPLGIPLSFMAMTNMREQILLHTTDLPFFVIVRNHLNSDRASSLGLNGSSYPIASTLLDFAVMKAPYSPGAVTYVGADVLQSLGWIDAEDLNIIRVMSVRINDYLLGLFHGLGLQLVDFKLTFGRTMRDYGDASDLIVTSQFTLETFTLLDTLNLITLPLEDYFLEQDALPEARRSYCAPYQEIARRLCLYRTPSSQAAGYDHLPSVHLHPNDDEGGGRPASTTRRHRSPK